jgi:hypothetical protein
MTTYFIPLHDLTNMGHLQMALIKSILKWQCIRAVTQSQGTAYNTGTMYIQNNRDATGNQEESAVKLHVVTKCYMLSSCSSFL